MRKEGTSDDPTRRGQMNRRAFFKLAAMAGLLAGCGQVEKLVAPTDSPRPTPPPPPTATPTTVTTSIPTPVPTQVPTATPTTVPVLTKTRRPSVTGCMLYWLLPMPSRERLQAGSLGREASPCRRVPSSPPP